MGVGEGIASEDSRCEQVSTFLEFTRIYFFPSSEV